MREVKLFEEPAELYKILKFEGITASGGEAKAVIAAGQVTVNGEQETRKRRKIHVDDVIVCGEETLLIVGIVPRGES